MASDGLFRISVSVDAISTHGRAILAGVISFAHTRSGVVAQLESTAQVCGRVRRSRRLGTPAPVDAAIVQATTLAEMNRLVALRVPAINVSNRTASSILPRIVADDVQAGGLAAEHLLGLGLRRLAFCGLQRHRYSALRCQGFADAARRAGVACSTYSSDDATPHRLSGWLDRLPKPCGLLAANDQRARRVVEACESIGLRVPDDVAVLGVDDDELACVTTGLPLSSVALASRQIGFLAGEAAWQLARGGKVAEETRVPPLAVVARRSTDLLAIPDPHVVLAMRYVRDHACEAIGVADVLAQVPISRRLLEVRFRKYVGRSVYAQIMYERINAARRLLVETELSIGQIASRVGFAEQRQLSAAFRQAVGQTPRAFRQTARTA